MFKSVAKTSAKARKLLARFENAARVHELKGAQNPEDWSSIEDDYSKSKGALRAMIANLEEEANSPSARSAVDYILVRVLRDPKFAWVMVHTEGLELLLAAQAKAIGKDFKEHSKEFMARVVTEDVRGPVIDEDWENAAHHLLWQAGRDEEFEELRRHALLEAEKRRVA